MLFATTCVAHNILDYGAIVDKTTNYAEVTNSMAILDAIMAAHSSDNDDRVIEIPAGHTFSSFPIRADNVKNITIQIDGTLLLSKDFKAFSADGFLTFHDTEDLTFKGTGTIDGQGFAWWIREYLQKNIHGRPHLL